MRLAVLSDIHANLHALEAVWADLEAQKPDAVYCLGDLVGYGAHPLDQHPQVEFRRVGYNVAEAARAVRESGLPTHFADLLETGGRVPAPRPEGV